MTLLQVMLEHEWKKMLCPFERVKKFRNGFSVKCPEETQVGWCTFKDESILNYLKVKRATSCVKCKETMASFLGVSGKARSTNK